MSAATYDFIAVGLGPFNLGLACLTDPITELNGLFLEKNEYFNWHPGMMMEESTLQTPFIGDLVTLADPTSRFSFLQFVKEQGRIYPFFIKEDFYPLRREFNQYCQWAAAKLKSIRYNTFVEGVERSDDGIYTIRTRSTKTGERGSLRTRKLVLGTGTVPSIPACCRGMENLISHTASYLDDKRELQECRTITIVGSGQSAAEVFHDLLKDIDQRSYKLNWITRSPRFFPLELTKLTLEMTSPDYSNYFQELDQRKRDEVVGSQANLFKGINSTLIDAIYDLLYAKRLSGSCNVSLNTNTELTSVDYDDRARCFTLAFRQSEQDQAYTLESEAVVLGTGYAYRKPEFLEGIEGRIAWDSRGRFAVRHNYAIDVSGAEIFVQNAELHTHGFVAPDLGMGAYRNTRIIHELLGRDFYAVEKDVTFQNFSVPVGAELQDTPAEP